MTSKSNKYYEPEYYSRHVDASFRSAKVVLALLYEIYQPKSIVDYGCGIGTWLAVAESFGTVKLTGFDGDWVSRQKLSSKNIDLKAVDLENITGFVDKHDLCIALEVAEHIDSNKAHVFINRLCESSDVVLFSAAIPQQAGTYHINEQWQSYWKKLFEDHNYKCYDLFRGKIWENVDVSWWYRQNIFLYVNKTSPLSSSISENYISPQITDIVHPENYISKVCTSKSSSVCSSILLRNAIRNMSNKPIWAFNINGLEEAISTGS